MYITHEMLEAEVRMENILLTLEIEITTVPHKIII